MLEILNSDFERCRFAAWEFSQCLFNGFRMCRVFAADEAPREHREEFRIKIIPKGKD